MGRFMLKRTFFAVMMAALVSGCASTGQGSEGRSDTLSRQQIQESGANNLYDVISRLRPQWLRAGGPRSFNLETEIVVFQNDMQLGGPDALRELSPELAYEIRYMDGGRAASALPGLMSNRHIAGAIIVDTRPPSS